MGLPAGPSLELLPTPPGQAPGKAEADQTSPEEEQRRRLRHGRCGNVHRPGEASAASLAAEYVGDEEVPGGIRGFQLSNRRIGNGKMEIIDVRSGSAIAVRKVRALDRGGEI